MTPRQPQAELTTTAEDVTRKEMAAIALLQRLARHWPKTLTLISYEGSLSVIHSADLPAIAEGFAPERQDLILADINGIPNEGGSW